LEGKMKLRQEAVKQYGKLTFDRRELIEKLGFDTQDSFDVSLIDWGRGGIIFTLEDGASKKYGGE
jgi:hypothetical protein